MPRFVAAAISGCRPHDFSAEDFAEYFIHFIELEVEKLEKTLKFFLHGNLGNKVMLKQFRNEKSELSQ